MSRLLGVHAMPKSIHIEQAVLFCGGTVEYFRDTAFNHSALAEADKVAALDGTK